MPTEPLTRVLRAGAPAALALLALGAGLGSWLIKMIVLIGFLAWLKHQDWFDRPVFFVTLLVGTFGLLMLEGWLVTRSPQYYTER